MILLGLTLIVSAAVLAGVIWRLGQRLDLARDQMLLLSRDLAREKRLVSELRARLELAGLEPVIQPGDDGYRVTYRYHAPRSVVVPRPAGRA